MEKFTEWLENELKERLWTVSQLAREANLNSGTVSNVLTRQRRVGPDVCLAIARALQVPPETVFRKAGLLPPKPQESLDEDQLLYIYRQLDEREQRQILAILKAYKESR